MEKKPSAPDRYEALLQLLRAANAIWDTSRVFFERWELSPSQFNILNLLRTTPHGLSQTEVSKQLLTHRSNVTGLIDRLERRRLVRRTNADEDRRAYRVILTARGAKLLKSILPHYHEEANHVWDGVSDQRIAALLDALEHVKRNASRVILKLPAKQKPKVP